jgi:hypothetical protein
MDKLCFIMPKDPEIYLVSLAVLQSYFQERKQREEVAGVITHLVVSVVTDSALQFLLDALPVPCQVLPFDTVLMCSDYDLVFAFDAEAAYPLSVATEKHITQTFGLLLGTDPKALPDLSALVEIEQAISGIAEDIDKSLFVFNELSLFTISGIVRAFEEDYPVLKWTATKLWKHRASAHDRFCSVLHAPMVIGERSFETMISAALGKTTVEFYPTTIHRRWLSKWSAKSYQMIYGLENVTPVSVLTALRTACHRLALVARHPTAVETRMVQ